MNPQELYHYVGRLIETVPSSGGTPQVPREVGLWVGRAATVIKNHCDMSEMLRCSVSEGQIADRNTRAKALDEIQLILFKVLADAESMLPPGQGGSFIPVGNALDFFTSLSKKFQSATAEIFIVDPYLDETILTDYGTAVPEGMRLRLLSDESTHKPSLIVAASAWVKQHAARRPLEVRLAPPRTLHDRAIFIDGVQAWTLTQSFKDFATRSPGEIVSTQDTASLKIPAYEQVWSASRICV
jgi:hypothetical protein